MSERFLVDVLHEAEPPPGPAEQWLIDHGWTISAVPAAACGAWAATVAGMFWTGMTFLAAAAAIRILWRRIAGTQ